MKKKICIIGNIVADFIAVNIDEIPEWGALYRILEPIQLNIGGNGAIASVWTAELGLKSFLIGKIGNDRIGDQLLSKLRAKKVMTEHITISKRYATGTTLALVNQSGERMFFHHSGSNEELNIGTVSRVPLEHMDALLISSIFILPRLGPEEIGSIFRRAKKHKIATVLDVAWDPKGKWDLGDKQEYVDYFLPNETELQHITHTTSLEKAVKRLQKMGIDKIIVKQGERGCTVFVEGKKMIRVRAPKVRAIDTTGAGDAFNAGFIFGLLEYGDIYASAKFATELATYSVTRVGGTTASAETFKVKNIKQGT